MTFITSYHIFFFCTFEDQSLLLCIHIFFKARVNVLFYYTATLLYFLKINFSPESSDFVWLCNSLHGYNFNMPPFYFIQSPFYGFTLFFFTHISFLLQRLAFVSVKKSACRKNYSHTFIRSFLICYGEIYQYFFIVYELRALILIFYAIRIQYDYFNQLHKHFIISSFNISLRKFQMSIKLQQYYNSSIESVQPKV